MTRLSLSLAMALFAVGCSGADESGAPGAVETGEPFAPLEQPCADVHEAAMTAEGAETRAEFRTQSAALVEAQRRLVSALAEIDPPTAVADAFSRYEDAIAEIVTLNDQPAPAGSDVAVARSLDAAETGLRAWEAKEEAGLPPSCPPAPERDVYAFLFVARANAACLELGDELEAEVAQIGTFTRREGADEAAELFQRVSERVALELRDALPPELDEPAVERLIRLYERRAEALGRLGEAFLARDREAYYRAARDERRAATAAVRLAYALGLGECQRLLGVRAT